MQRGNIPWLAEAWRTWGSRAAQCRNDYELHLESGLTRHRCRVLFEHVQRFGAVPPQDVEVGVEPHTAQIKAPGKRGASFDQDGTTAVAEFVGRIKTLEDLLLACEVDTEEWRVRSYRINKWEVGAKDESGNIVVEPLFQIRADLERRLCDVVAPPVPNFHLPPVVTRPERRFSDTKTAIILPDAQIGFRWANGYRYLDPMHDRAAMDVALQAIQLTQPDEVIILGDMLDLAPWSMKYPRPMDVHDTTNPSLWEWYWWLCQIVQAAPNAHIVYMEGNHEHRIHKVLIERMPEASTIRDVGSERDLLSIENLLHLDELGVDYRGPYGAEYWLWEDKAQIIHGEIVRGTTGGTAMAVAQKSKHSVVYGHIHRLELLQRRINGPKGSDVITIMSPGCLCRVDGMVPGQSARPDWQQGIGVARLDVATGHMHMTALPILDGTLVLDGDLLTARERSEEIAEFSGIPQLVR